MKRFTLQILLLYTFISIIFVGGVIIISNNDRKENRYPRKNIYIVNLTGDTVSIHLTGSYTKAEKKLLTDKPDTYTFSDRVENLPYLHSYSTGITTMQAIRFRIPHKCDKEINFPENFTVHIQNQYGEILLTRQQFFRLTKGKPSDNTWTLYLDPSLIPQSPDTEEETLTAIFD